MKDVLRRKRIAIWRYALALWRLEYEIQECIELGMSEDKINRVERIFMRGRKKLKKFWNDDGIRK